MTPDPSTPSPTTRGAAQRGSWRGANSGPRVDFTGMGVADGATARPRRRTPFDRECPESVSGHDTGGTRDGTCTWCGKKVGRAAPMPKLGHDYRTELDLEYRRMYDPDWGNDPYDA
jgi:hypothetical protein